MKLTFQDKTTLRNIALSNRELSANEIIGELIRVFDLTKDQKEYIRNVKKLNG
jgi:hypothetical protein